MTAAAGLVIVDIDVDKVDWNGAGTWLSIAVLTAAFLLLPSWASAAPKTARASVSSSEAQGNAGSNNVALSGAGRYIAFDSSASNLVPSDTNAVSDIFVRDRKRGITRRVSLSSAEGQADAYSSTPAISPGGRFVAFISNATNLVAGDTNGATDVFIRDRKLGTTRRVSLSSAEVQGDAASYGPAISSDGRFVTFESGAENLVGGDTNNSHDVFIRDRKRGTTRRVSLSSAESQGDGDSYFASVSVDARFVAFSSESTNLAVGDTNAANDIFVRDRTRGTTTRVSRRSGGTQGNAGSYYPEISATGRFVVFDSGASNLVPGDTNAALDVFVRDRKTGTTRRVSKSSTGAQANGLAHDAEISGSGRFIVFESQATNLVGGDTNAISDIFVRDRRAGTTRRLSRNSGGGQANGVSYYPVISVDGRFVAFESAATNLVAADTNASEDAFFRGPLR